MAPSPGFLARCFCRLLLSAVVACKWSAAVDPGAWRAAEPGCPDERRGHVLPPAWNRRQRQQASCFVGHVTARPAWNPLSGFGLRPRLKLHHRCRRLFQAQRRPWCRQRLHRRCGLRGVRVAEARNPGPTHDASARPRSPADADRPSHRRRVSAASHNLVFCPVAGCCKGDPERSSGWSSHQGLRHHLDDHCSGDYSGAIPQQYLDERGLDLCSVCGLTVKRQFNGCHPRCRPTARASVPRPA